ncbi:MAG: TraC family protein [Candidatus Woesebacteria bacterium]
MNKFKNKASSRSQMNVQEVKDGVLVLPGKKYRMIIETSAVNFELKSEEEQDQIIDTYQNFLNSLPCQVQILIRTREVDIDGYLEDFMAQKEQEQETVYKEQLDEYTLFIKKLISGNKILTRKFYVIVPYTSEDRRHDFSLIKEQLQVSVDIIAKGLERLGMKTRSLGNLETLDLFYSFYNPAHTKSQPLTQEALQALTGAYGV